MDNSDSPVSTIGGLLVVWTVLDIADWWGFCLARAAAVAVISAGARIVAADPRQPTSHTD